MVIYCVCIKSDATIRADWGCKLWFPLRNLVNDKIRWYTVVSGELSIWLCLSSLWQPVKNTHPRCWQMSNNKSIWYISPDAGEDFPLYLILHRGAKLRNTKDKDTRLWPRTRTGMFCWTYFEPIFPRWVLIIWNFPICTEYISMNLYSSVGLQRA